MTGLSRLAAPTILDEPDFETLLAERKARLIAAAPAELREGLAAALQLESEAITIDLQQQAYSELVLRQYVNECARASMLRYATGADLDARAADYGVSRLLITPANPDATPPAEAVWEDDERLRFRAQMALEGLSVAGSRGAYIFHALSASPAVADVSVESPEFALHDVPPALRAQLPPGAFVLTCVDAVGLVDPLPGDVSVTVLTEPAGLTEPLQRVRDALSAEDVRPLTDRPRVAAGIATDFRIVAVIEAQHHLRADDVLQLARQQIAAAVAQSRRLGGLLSQSAVYAALHTAGARRVDVIEPAADIVCDARHYPNCLSIDIRNGAPV